MGLKLALLRLPLLHPTALVHMLNFASTYKPPGVCLLIIPNSLKQKRQKSTCYQGSDPVNADICKILTAHIDLSWLGWEKRATLCLPT